MREWTHACGLLALGVVFTLSTPQTSAAAEIMTGCLETVVSGFVLNTSNDRLAVTGGENIDFKKHDGHTVKLTGDKQENGFRVTALEHVSPTCGGESSGASPAAAKKLTAADQGNSEADIQTTAKIRRAIVEDEKLSVLAQNVTIVTRDGKVTLLGDVRSMDEKSAVAAKAQTVAGVSVDNQITVNADSRQPATERRKENGK